MTDRQALLAAIIAHPDEDTPRLAFADWLDERGDAYFADWAALIRAQVEAARVERFSPRWVELARVQHDLFDRRKKDWDAGWGGSLGMLAFRRGFREAVTVDAAAFGARADLLFRGNPIRALHLAELTDPLGRPQNRKLARSPYLERLETLDLSDTRVEHAEAFLAEAGDRLRNLRALGLARSGANTTDVLRVLARPALARVTALDLRDNPVSQPHGLRDLVGSERFPRLTWLDLSGCGLGDDAATAFDGAAAGELRVLRLAEYRGTAGPGLGPDGVRAVGGLRAPRLEHLDLSGQNLADEAAVALAGAPLLGGLRELKLEGTRLGDAGVRAIAASPRVGNLRWLGLFGNTISDDGIEALLLSPHLGSAVMLDLWRYPDLPEPVRARLAARFPLGRFDHSGPFRPQVPGLFEPCP